MLKAIFIEQRYTLLLKAAFEVSLRRGVTACAGNINTDPKYQALPNPHLYYYTCLGSYVNRMYDAVQKRDLEQLYSLLAHSTSCINFADGTVIHRFFQMFKEDSAFIDQNCICDKDNNMYTIRDFREIIRREQEQANEDA